jgi:ABC-type branched-subunit amino acid transport system substrate-binding protein
MGQLEPDIIIKERYKIIEVLKSGKFSTTCIVSDSNGKTFILKEFLSSYSDKYEKEERSKQFKSYIISIKQMDHPFLVKLVDAFQDGNKYYIVMEYIEGILLDHFIKEEKLPLNEIDVLNLGKKITELISYLHSRKSEDFVMISIAPSDIILDRKNNPRLINFRFDKILLDYNTKEFNGYISPEEYSGFSENSLPSDIYSLGVLLHQLLTGRDPAINPFKFYSAKKINSSVTGKTSSFISKATEYNPSLRYKNVMELREALKLCLKEAEEYAKSAPSLSLLIKGQNNISSKIIAILAAILCLFIAIFFVSFITDFFKKNKKIDRGYDLKMEGINSYNSGEYNIAFDYLTKYLSVHPDDGEAMIYKENSYLNIKNNRSLDIAVAGPLSGPYGNYGKSMLQGVALAQKIINSEKRIADYSMRIILRDDKGARVNDIANEITNMNSILGVIGHIQDNSTVGPIYNGAGIPQIIPFSLKNNYNSGGYSISNSAPLQAKMLAKYSVVERGSKRIILIYDDSNYEFVNLYKVETIDLGGEIIKTISFNYKHSDIALEISKLKPELIFIAGDIENIKLICSILQENHIPAQCFIAGSQIFLIDPGESTLQGVMFATLFNVRTNDVNAQKFIQLFTDNFGGAVPNPLNALSYDATLLMAKAISEGGAKREDIKNYLSSLGGKIPPFIGVTGVTAFDKTGSVQKDMLLINIKNHMFQPVGVISI